MSKSFDIWLDRSLRVLHEGIQNEPVPKTLVEIIEADRVRKQNEAAAVHKEEPDVEAAEEDAVAPVFSTGMGR